MPRALPPQYVLEFTSVTPTEEDREYNFTHPDQRLMPSLDGSTYTIRIKYGEDLLLEMEGRAVQLNPWELERMLDLFNDFADVLGRR